MHISWNTTIRDFNSKPHRCRCKHWADASKVCTWLSFSWTFFRSGRRLQALTSCLTFGSASVRTDVQVKPCSSSSDSLQRETNTHKAPAASELCVYEQKCDEWLTPQCPYWHSPRSRTAPRPATQQKISPRYKHTHRLLTLLLVKLMHIKLIQTLVKLFNSSWNIMTSYSGLWTCMQSFYCFGKTRKVSMRYVKNQSFLTYFIIIFFSLWQVTIWVFRDT